jgi:hypothetical protein
MYKTVLMEKLYNCFTGFWEFDGNILLLYTRL